MLLNKLWIGLFATALVTGLVKLIGFGDLVVFQSIVDAMFSSAKVAFEIALYLTGALCLWMGIMQIGEQGGALRHLTRFVSPLFEKLFPDVPKGHPAIGAMMMNFSANMLGLDNAATPLGLKAMTQLQTINPEKDKASNAQIMFLVLNTSGLTIIPVSILAFRMSANSSNPSEVFLPILITTFISSLAGLIFVGIKQGINLLHPTIIAYVGSATLLIGGLLAFLIAYPDYSSPISNVAGNLILFLIVIVFIWLGVRSKINVYESFVEGAKGGFDVAIKIIPFLVAILVAVAVFRASGAMELLFDGVKEVAMMMGVKCLEFIDALPTAFMKPFSGSASRGMMLDVFSNPNQGPDSFAGRLASTFQGSTETTFYVLSVYFGSVGIKKMRYAAGAGLFADAIGIIAAIIISFIFFSC
jgi:spore maturation protein SpmA/spore maturation protein SpmB